MAVLKAMYHSFRSGETRSIWNHPSLLAPELISMTSTDFAPGGAIPLIHSGTGVGDNQSPQLAWTGVPPVAEQLLLIIEDTDAPLPRPIIHTIALLGSAHSSLPTGGLSSATASLIFMPASLRRRGYQGPRPLPGHGPHHYGFNLFALATEVVRPDRIRNWHQLINTLDGLVLARGRLIGLQER
ncbi:MAG: YbhB/YbcL family Raf kinase inhibitor-like protein [Ferrimicrobium sp.]|nr:YbhB/YbcL family Raf kinase inhibitor-like protein [Ferrimicrobium sp.]